MENGVLEHILDGRKEPSNLPFALLKNITENFSEEQVIGQGGFATVYKGVLSNRIVAVKRIKNSHTIDEKLFYREVNNLLNVNHQNIVPFLGYCANTEQTAIKIDGSRHHIYAEIRERLLCFQYMGNGSLQKHIADELRGFEWTTRYQIIKGILKGLHYLHKEKNIIHMDLKPENILLDYCMVPKITDFGLSRLDDKSQTMSANRCATLGYCAPEYLHAGRMSFKTDMYSLGIIIIELVTGYKGVSDHNSVLRRWRHRWNKSAKEIPLLHQQLQVSKCLKIGMRCQEHDPCKRPFIWDVIHDINEMECTYGRISNANESSISQISSYAEDDMLGIEPLELHFTFGLNKCMSSSFQLNNGTDSSMAFNIQTTSPLPYCMLPKKGIVPPRSNRTIYITLQPQEKVPQHANELIVRSIKVNNGREVADINDEMFSRQTGEVVDEVNLDIVFDAQLHVGVCEDVYKHVNHANCHFGYFPKRNMFSCGAEKRLHDPIETPQDGLLRPCSPPDHSNYHKMAKRFHHHSIDTQGQEALAHHLCSVFPDIDPQLIQRALEASEHDLDSAIKSLHMLWSESSQAIPSAVGSESQNGLPTDVQAYTPSVPKNNHKQQTARSTGVPAISTAICHQSENGLTTAVQPSAKDTRTNEWVEFLLREMLVASDMDDARARATTAFEALKKSILDPARAKAVPDPESDTHGSL